VYLGGKLPLGDRVAVSQAPFQPGVPTPGVAGGGGAPTRRERQRNRRTLDPGSSTAPPPPHLPFRFPPDSLTYPVQEDRIQP